MDDDWHTTNTSKVPGRTHPSPLTIHDDEDEDEDVDYLSAFMTSTSQHHTVHTIWNECWRTGRQVRVVDDESEDQEFYHVGRMGAGTDFVSVTQNWMTSLTKGPTASSAMRHMKT